MNRFYLFLLFIFISGTAFSKSTTNEKTELPERIISVYFRNAKGLLNTMFNECVRAGRAKEGLRADWQQQFASVKKRMRIQIYPNAWIADR